MKKKKPFSGLTFYIILALIIFIIDIPLPKGVVVWILYIFPIAGISKTGNRKQIFILTGLISLFLLIGYSLSPDWTESKYFAAWNRIIGLISLWIFAFILIKRKESDKELNESKRQFASIIDTAMDGIMVIDENQRVLLFNKACEDIFHTTASEAIGESIERFIPQRFHEPHRQNIKMFEKENNLHRMMGPHGFVTGVKSDGGELPLEASVSQFEIGGKKYYTIVHRDITERKKTEEALKLSEEKFTIAFRSNPNAIVLSSLDDGKIEEVNVTFLELFGYESSEVIGRTSVDLNLYVNQDDRNRAVNLLRRDGKIKDFETQIITKKKEVRTVLLSSELLEISGRQLFLTTIQDITGRKLAEKVLRESEKNFRLLAEAMPQLVWTANPDGTVDYYNSKVQEFDGFKQKDDGNWEWSAVLYEEDSQRTVEVWSNALKTGNVYEITHRVKRKDGSFKWLLSRGTPIKNSEGKIIKWFGTATDIHQEKINQDRLEKALQELKDSEAKLLEAQKLARMCSYLFDINSGIIEVSDEFYNIFEIEKSEEKLTMGAILNRVHPDDLQNFKNAYEEAIDKNKLIYEFEFKIITPSNKVKHIAAYTKILIGNSIQNRKIFGTILDITERKLFRIKLEDTLTELQRSNRELEQFAYIASHDLQEPIRMVKSYSELLNKKYHSELNENALDYLGFISDAANRMHQLVIDLLKYSRISTKAKPFEMVDCNEVLTDVLSDLKFAIQETNADINYNHLPVIFGDKTQIRQVFQNLIQNGIKFRTGNIPKIEVCCEKKNKVWLFSIKDNGIGIEKEHLERIFVIFQRLHTREEFPGTGIGLAIVKKIIERHGGEIYAESAIGKGSVFYFTIPIS